MEASLKIQNIATQKVTSSFSLGENKCSEEVMSGSVKLPRLNGSNYQEWASIVKPLLIEEEIDITVKKLDVKLNAKALRIIRSTLSREKLPTVINTDSALETWKILQNQYSIMNSQKRKLKLFKLLSIEKQPNETLAQYFGRAKLLWAECNQFVKEDQGVTLITEEIMMISVIRGLHENLKSVVMKWSWDTLDMQTLESKLLEGSTMRSQGHANYVNKNKKKGKKFRNSSKITSNNEEKEQWKKAMDEEMLAMKENQVCIMVDKPKDCKLVSTKWVYTVKTDANGEVQRYKARLVARGFSQEYGINFNETFSPVIRTESLRLLLTIAIRKQLKLRQFDIKTAFLNGELQELVYIKQPTGYEDGTQRVCNLKRALYGLKQSPRMWNQGLVNFWKEYGFEQCRSDQCVLMMDNMILGMHVDDLVLLYETEKQLETFIKAISSKFEVKDLGELNYFLNIKIERKVDCVVLSQHKFIEETIDQFNIRDAKPLYTPLDGSIKLSNSQCPTDQKEINEMKKYPFRELIGKLNYLCTNTRPDIAISVSKLSRFMNNPGMIHWKLAIKVLRYVKTTKDYCLVLKPKDDLISVYSDADWAGEIDDRRSTSGHCIFFGGALISWKTKLQSAISMSTMESEFYALTYAIQEVQSVNYLLEELGIKQEKAIIVHEDNQSAIKFSNNSSFKGRAKHIDLRHNYVKDLIEKGFCVLKYCETEKMLADIFTKPVDRTKLKNCCEVIGCCSTQGECCGSVDDNQGKSRRN